MHRKGTSPRRALLVFLRHPGKDIVILVEVVADQPGAVISIGINVIVDIVLVKFDIGVIRTGLVTFVGGVRCFFFRLFISCLDCWFVGCLHAFWRCPATPAADHRLGIKLCLAPGTYNRCPVEIIIPHAARQACTLQTEICLGHNITYALYAGANTQFCKPPPE